MDGWERSGWERNGPRRGQARRRHCRRCGGGRRLPNAWSRASKIKRNLQGGGEAYCELTSALFATREGSKRGRPREMERERFGQIQTWAKGTLHDLRRKQIKVVRQASYRDILRTSGVTNPVEIGNPGVTNPARLRWRRKEGGRGDAAAWGRAVGDRKWRGPIARERRGGRRAHVAGSARCWAGALRNWAGSRAGPN